MVTLDSVLGFILIIALIVFFVFFRKKLFALIADIAIGTVVYLVAVFVVSFVGLIPPIQWTIDLYPVMIFGFIAYHFYSNYSQPQRHRPLGAL